MRTCRACDEPCSCSCSACGLGYCSAKCQQSDWAEHKAECRAMSLAPSALRKLADMPQAQGAEHLLELGDVLSESGHPELARPMHSGALLLALREGMDSARFYQSCGRTMYKLDAFSEAYQLFSQGLWLAGDEHALAAELRLGQALALRTAGLQHAALEILVRGAQSAMAREPPPWGALHSMLGMAADIYAVDGDDEQAALAFTSAVDCCARTHPSDWRSVCNVARRARDFFAKKGYPAEARAAAEVAHRYALQSEVTRQTHTACGPGA